MLRWTVPTSSAYPREIRTVKEEGWKSEKKMRNPEDLRTNPVAAMEPCRTR